MKKQEKIDILNTLNPRMVDYSCDGEEVEYISVPWDEESKAVIKKLGIPDDAIDFAVSFDVIDIAYIGFAELGAEWWSRKNGFFLEKPIEKLE